MDERDKDLTGLFVRDLDEITLPPRGAWRSASGRETIAMRSSRYLLTAGAVAALLAIALIVGFQLRDRNATVANPSASPTPSASGAPVVNPSASASVGSTASPSPASGPGGAIYNDDFGFIVTTGDIVAANIRKESSNARIGGFASQDFAVSPDGTQIAYWSVGTSSEPSQIRIISAANPQSLGALSTLSANERGGVIVWANDSSGVAYTVSTGDTTSSSTIRTFNTRPGNVGPGQLVITWNETGRFLQPIAWDRTTNLLAAGVTGDGGFMTDYLVASTATPQAAAKRTPVTGRVTMSSVRASTDAKFVVGVDIDSGFSYWPLADYSAKHAPAESKYGNTGALWRPGTHEIGFIGPSNQFWLCDIARDTPLGCGQTAFSGVPDGAFVRTFRADGSAVVLAVPVGGGAGQTNYTLVRFTGDSFAAKATGGERVTFSDLGGLTVTVSVRFR
ncbi:MAG TPA: hypothetical protein VGS17_14580 [Candidatus Limnocylindria bacterium]|nr:hypothetical protein [Candidatus Limnocylindria bacterium]